MKIVEAKATLLHLPVERYLAGGKEVTGHSHVLAQVTTSDGVTGFGYVVPFQPILVKALANATNELAQHLIGMNVLEVEAAWERLSRAADWCGPGGLLNYAIAPLDVALWDAAGKTIGQPVYRMLGGARKSVPAYASEGYWYDRSPAQLVERAKADLAAGFKALKPRVGREKHPEGEMARLAAIREVVGPDVTIMVDAAQSWDVARALQCGRLLQEADIHWLEDPVQHQNVAGMARVAQALDIPIATGENLYQLSEFATLFDNRAVGIAIIDLGRIGGVTPWRRVAALAQARHIRVCGHVLPEHHVHLLAGVSNGYMVEHVPRSVEIIDVMPAVENGHLVCSDRPGFGMELNEAAVRRFTVQA